MANNKVQLADGTVLMDTTGVTVTQDTLLAGYTALDRSGATITGTVATAPASSTTPAMDGTADAGSEDAYARGDHVHPTDTSRQAALISGTNIKTINGESVLGSGDIEIQGGSDPVEVVTYGTSTYAEVTAALSSGKPVICYDPSVDRVALYDRTASGTIYFIAFNNTTGRITLHINSAGTWGYATNALASTASPAFTGTPTAPTAAAGTNTTQIATTAFVKSATVAESDKLTSADTRSTNELPSTYMADGVGITSEFKANSAIGAGASYKNFWQIVTHTPWYNNSGNVPVQEAFAVDTAGEPMMKIRGSATDGASWGSWKSVSLEGHDHAAEDITSGTLPVNRGGTGAASFTANRAIISGSTTTGAFTTRAITNNTAATSAITGSTNLLTMNTLRYALNRTTGPGTADTNYGTSMMRPIKASTTDLTAGSSSLTSGAIYLVYEA